MKSIVSLFLVTCLFAASGTAGEMKKKAKQTTSVEISYPYFSNEKIDTDVQKWLSEKAVAMLDGEPTAIAFDP